MSHLHFVANDEAKKRLRQMGEKNQYIFVIGSPDIDLMVSDTLPSFDEAIKRYDIPFEKYGILIFHPVTTELKGLKGVMRTVTDSLLESKRNFIAIYPNTDPGTDIILEEYRKKLMKNPQFVIHPSLSFESFLVLLKNADFIIGNSSAGIREAPFYGVPTINLGSRQNNRAKLGEISSIVNCGYNKEEILSLIEKFSKKTVRFKPQSPFGGGNSDKNFIKILEDDLIWETKIQKQFNEIDF